MVVALASPITPSLTLSSNPEVEITKAIELWEQANELLLAAGRLFAQTKQQTKRKFNQLIQDAYLEKSQVSKLIKAAELADEIPSSAVSKLGLLMLLQLAQKRNQIAREAIADDDTQLLVAQKIKELRVPTEPKDERPVRFVGKKGKSKLRIEVPESPQAIQLEIDWVNSGLPPLEWLSRRVDPPDPNQEQQLIALVPTAITQGGDLPATPTPTERYKQGWQVGARCIPNSVGGEHFVNWCEGQPVTIESIISGQVGQIQGLRVTRHDGQTSMSFGNWLEEVCSPTVTSPVQEVESPNYTKISQALLKAKKWEKVTELVAQSSTTLSKAIDDWSPENKEKLKSCLAKYLESNPQAIFYHELDWIPQDLLQKALSSVCFKVRDVSAGLAAEWIHNCEFVKVENFGKDGDEVWTFNTTEQQVKTWSRENFQVVKFQ